MTARKREPVVVCHDLEHARAALAAATDLGVAVTLSTAPGAAAYAGPAYLKQILDRALGEHPGADAELVIDCGDDPALALAALRLGWRRVLFAGPAKTRARLADIARQHGAEIAIKRAAGLDLGDSADALTDCRAWLERAARRR